jgi:hypothetical protein
VSTIGGGVTQFTTGSDIPPIPVPPYDLQVIGLSSTSVNLLFQSCYQDVTSYDIERDGVVTSGVTATAQGQLTVTGLTVDTSYEFRVRGRNSNGVGDWSLAKTGATLGAEVGSFSDGFTTDRRDEYEWFGDVADQWQWDEAAAQLYGPAGGNAQRAASPKANFGSGMRVEGVIGGWDTTRYAGVIARFNGQTGVAFFFHNANGGEWRLYDLNLAGGNVVARSKIAAVPTLPVTVRIDVPEGSDVYTCRVDGVVLDWTDAGATTTTITGHTGARAGLYCFDDDAKFNSLTVTAL